MTRRVAFYRLMDRSSFERLALAHGYTLERIITASSEQPYEQIWRVGDSELHYLEDPYLGHPYVLIRGPREVEITRVINDELPTRNIDEAVKEYRQAGTVQQQLIALGLIGATAPEEMHQDALACVTTGLRDGDAQVRRGSLTVCAYLLWPEFRPYLVEFALTEPDALLQSVASRLVDRLDAM